MRQVNVGLAGDGQTEPERRRVPRFGRQGRMLCLGQPELLQMEPLRELAREAV